MNNINIHRKIKLLEHENHPYNLILLFALALCVLVGLSDCGGSGNSGSSSSSTMCLNCSGLSGTAYLDCELQQPKGCPSNNEEVRPKVEFPVAAVMSSYVLSAHNYTLHSTDGVNTYSLTVTNTPGTPSSFEGQAASTSSTTKSLAENNNIVNTESLNDFFTQNPYTPLGEQNLSNGEYSKATSQGTLPTTATVGESGKFYTLNTFTNDTMSTLYATTTTTWSLTENTATTAWLCFDYSKTIVGSSGISESNCYNIDNSGNISAVKANVFVNGTTMSFN